MARKLLYNGWKNKKNRICKYCGRPYAERHEVFAGSNRQNSIREGLQIDVCPEHHRELQYNITRWAQEENKRLKAQMERDWIRRRMDEGISEDAAVREWMTIIGRNYCEEIQPD